MAAKTETPLQLTAIAAFESVSPVLLGYIFDVPVDLARSAAAYRHDQDIPELGELAFEVLARTQPAPKQSWIKRLLGV